MIQRSLLRHNRACSSLFPSTRTTISSSSSCPKPLRAVPRQHEPFSRYYSTTKESSDSSSSDVPIDGASETQSQVENPVQKELDTNNREIIDLKDKYLRSVAEFRNLQDRTKRDIDAARSFAITRFANDLIESVDNLDRALGTVPAEKVGQSDSNKELENLYEGLKMTDAILMQTLKKHGLERFDPSVEGEMFNPNRHEATFQTKVDGKVDGSVFMTQQKGFILNGRVVRAAKVGVVKNS